MKTECAYTRARIRRYLQGYLFLPQQRRMARHLAACPVCSTELDAVRRIDETRRLLQDVESPGGTAAISRSAARAFAAARRLVYRPLRLGLVIGAVAAAYLFVLMPILHDPDLERLDAAVRAAGPDETNAPAAAPVSPPAAVAAKEPRKTEPAPPEPAADPLIVTITVEREQERESIQEINDAMKEHTLLQKMQFSDSVREISGSLTAHELSTFFSRILGNGRISYKRSRLAAAESGEQIPFVVRVRTAQSRPPTPQAAAEAPQGKNVDKSVEKPAEKPAEKHVENPGERRADKPAPPSGQ